MPLRQHLRQLLPVEHPGHHELQRVLAVAIEETADSQAVAAAAEAFRAWSELLENALKDHGVQAPRAKSLAQELTALLESVIEART